MEWTVKAVLENTSFVQFLQNLNTRECITDFELTGVCSHFLLINPFKESLIPR